MPQSKHIVTLR